MIIDFITKLLKSENSITKNIFDSILVVVDKLTKYTILILYKETYNTEQLEFLLLNYLIKNYNISKDIIFDRDKFFIFRYWKTLIIYLDIKLKLLIVYYLTTNEQSEKII